MNCITCGKKLTADDAGATKKLVNRGASEFLCIDCLAKRFGVTRELIEQKITAWKRMGCLLFPPEHN